MDDKDKSKFIPPFSQFEKNIRVECLLEQLKGHVYEYNSQDNGTLFLQCTAQGILLQLLRTRQSRNFLIFRPSRNWDEVVRKERKLQGLVDGEKKFYVSILPFDNRILITFSLSFFFILFLSFFNSFCFLIFFLSHSMIFIRISIQVLLLYNVVYYNISKILIEFIDSFVVKN